MLYTHEQLCRLWVCLSLWLKRYFICTEIGFNTDVETCGSQLLDSLLAQNYCYLADSILTCSPLAVLLSSLNVDIYCHKLSFQRLPLASITNRNWPTTVYLKQVQQSAPSNSCLQAVAGKCHIFLHSHYRPSLSRELLANMINMFLQSSHQAAIFHEK